MALKFLKKSKTIRIINYIIEILVFFLIIAGTKPGHIWDKSRFDIFLLLAILLLVIKTLLNSHSYTKTNDELRRQISIEVFAKTYSLVIPIISLLGLLILVLLGNYHEARVVIVTISIFYYAEKIVRHYVFKKYDYEEAGEENY